MTETESRILFKITQHQDTTAAAELISTLTDGQFPMGHAGMELTAGIYTSTGHLDWTPAAGMMHKELCNYPYFIYSTT